MIPHRLINAFLLAAPIALGGCASTTPVVDKNTCNSWDESSLRIPLITDILVKDKAVNNASCNRGRMIGYSALLGQYPDGTLHPASLITWNNSYQKLIREISAYNPQEIRDAKTQREFNALAQTRTFADHFIREASHGLVTSPIAKSMFEMKLTDPKLFTPDGKYSPPAKKDLLCTGTGMYRICKPREDTPQELAPQ